MARTSNCKPLMPSTTGGISGKNRNNCIPSKGK